MRDKYIRISDWLHERLKIKSAQSHMTLKDLAERGILKILRQDFDTIKAVNNQDKKTL